MISVRAQLYTTLFASVLLFMFPGSALSAKDPLLIPMYSLLLSSSGVPVFLVKDIFQGIDDSEPEELVVLNGVLYFGATDGVRGNEIWTSDGTAAGTKIFKDINEGAGDSNSYTNIHWNRDITLMGNSFYFAATDGNHRVGLWKSDGTADGTSNLHSVSPGKFIVLKNALYFSGYDGSDSELWTSDGTPGGTEMVKNISENSNSYPGGSTDGFTLYKNEIYFSASNTNSNSTAEYCGLWKSDGTPGGTVAVKPADDQAKKLEPSRMAVCNNTLYFAAYDDTNSYDFWKSDGTPTGTEKLSNYQFSQAPGRFTEYNGNLYFAAEDSTSGRELWRLDCSSDVATIVKDINPNTAGSNPQNLTVMGDTLYFKAEDADYGLELWKTDGTGPNTMRVKDINPGSEGSSVEGITAYNGMLYFTADDGEHGDELWWSDGTEAGTKLLKDLNPGPDWSYPYEFTAMNGTLFFTATDATNGWELWKLEQ